MGNSLISPCFCFLPNSSSPAGKLIFWGGATELITKNHRAAELMNKFPDHVLCHADSFYIGRPAAALSIDDVLNVGETYFVIPVDRFPFHSLTASSLASLSSSGKKRPSLVEFGRCPFEYVNDSDGKMVIKVVPEFIIRLISAAAAERSSTDHHDGGEQGGLLCSTPELRKQYEQLVGSRDRPWSPKLETIAERKARMSPGRMCGNLEKIMINELS